MLATLALPQTSSIISESRQLLDGTFSEDEESDDASLELTDDEPLQISDLNTVKKDDKRDIQCVNLKDELRNKIQERRRSVGKDELRVSFEPPSTYNLTADEKKKCEIRRQRNRDSANKSRLKRKFQLEYLEKEVEDLTSKNNRLSSTVNALKQVKDTLDKALQSHKCEHPKQMQERTAIRTTFSQTSHGQRTNMNIHADEYNRGRIDFQKLSPEKQKALLLAFEKRRDSLPGTSSNC